MAFSYGFYNSMNGDRKYNAEQMSAIFDGVITDGVFDSIGELFATVPGTGLQVLVKSGRAWFDSTWSYNDSALPLSLSAPDLTRTRIDAVVLEVNHTQNVRKNSIKIVQGTPNTTPARPSLTNNDLVHQYPLAYVSVKGNAKQINAADIQIMVGQNPCPFVTSVLQSVPIDDLYSKWEGEFNTWFNNLKAQLTDNVVTNLQRQIDAKVNVADKATPAEVLAGTNDTKWVSPLGVKQLSGAIPGGSRPVQTKYYPYMPKVNHYRLPGNITSITTQGTKKIINTASVYSTYRNRITSFDYSYTNDSNGYDITLRIFRIHLNDSRIYEQDISVVLNFNSSYAPGISTSSGQYYTDYWGFSHAMGFSMLGDVMVLTSGQYGYHNSSNKSLYFVDDKFDSVKIINGPQAYKLRCFSTKTYIGFSIEGDTNVYYRARNNTTQSTNNTGGFSTRPIDASYKMACGAYEDTAYLINLIYCQYSYIAGSTSVKIASVDLATGTSNYSYMTLGSIATLFPSLGNSNHYVWFRHLFSENGKSYFYLYSFSGDHNNQRIEKVLNGVFMIDFVNKTTNASQLQFINPDTLFPYVTNTRYTHALPTLMPRYLGYIKERGEYFLYSREQMGSPIEKIFYFTKNDYTLKVLDIPHRSFSLDPVLIFNKSFNLYQSYDGGMFDHFAINRPIIKAYPDELKNAYLMDDNLIVDFDDMSCYEIPFMERSTLTTLLDFSPSDDYYNVGTYVYSGIPANVMGSESLTSSPNNSQLLQVVYPQGEYQTYFYAICDRGVPIRMNRSEIGLLKRIT